MAGEDEADALARLQGDEEVRVFLARHTEYELDALLFEALDEKIGCLGQRRVSGSVGGLQQRGSGVAGARRRSRRCRGARQAALAASWLAANATASRAFGNAPDQEKNGWVTPEYTFRVTSLPSSARRRA